jgi:hypothetical protein
MWVRNGNRNRKFSGLSVAAVWAVLGLSLAGSALAEGKGRVRTRPSPCQGRICAGVGGGELPTPFEARNRTVELAAGETYLLSGKVVFLKSSKVAEALGVSAFLQIDLESHPWLASARRKANPYYPLVGPASYWRNHEGRDVRLNCEAQGRVLFVDDFGPQYEILLDPLADVEWRAR